MRSIERSALEKEVPSYLSSPLITQFLILSLEVKRVQHAKACQYFLNLLGYVLSSDENFKFLNLQASKRGKLIVNCM